MIGNDEIKFPAKLLLINKQVSKIHKTFANGLTVNIKLSKPQLSITVLLGGFLGKLLRPVIKPGLSLIGSVRKPLVKSDLAPLGLTAAASATDAAIQNKIFRSRMKTN